MTSKRQQQEEAGRWLRRAREQRGFQTVGALARHMGVSDSLVSRIETGISSASDERAQQIAEALRMDIIEVRRNLGLWVPDWTEPHQALASEWSEADELLKRITVEVLTYWKDRRGRDLGENVTTLLREVRGEAEN